MVVGCVAEAVAAQVAAVEVVVGWGLGVAAVVG